MKARTWLPAFFALTSIALAACNLGKEKPVPTIAIDPNEVATSVAGTLEAELASIPTPTETPLPALLPHSLYFLSSASGSAQIWRLGVDGQNPEQFSQEAQGVDYFDVSRADGRVALVSANRLVLLSADGGERSVLVDGSGDDPEAPDYYYRLRISEPRFSPDGATLAYGLDGVNLLDLESGESQQVLLSNIEDTGGGLRPGELFFPEAWSPDGERLLVSIGYLEGGSLGVLEVGSGEFNALQANGILCCHPTWAPDSESIVVASPYLGIISPGLWRYPASTGAESELVPGVDEDGGYSFFAWPREAASGDLYYFFASSETFPEGDVPLAMARSGPDGVSNRTELRGDSFLLREALWAEDGSLALIVEAAESGAGPLILVRADGGEPQVLNLEAQQLRWGP